MSQRLRKGALSRLGFRRKPRIQKSVQVMPVGCSRATTGQLADFRLNVREGNGRLVGQFARHFQGSVEQQYRLYYPCRKPDFERLLRGNSLAGQDQLAGIFVADGVDSHPDHTGRKSYSKVDLIQGKAVFPFGHYAVIRGQRQYRSACVSVAADRGYNRLGQMVQRFVEIDKAAKEFPHFLAVDFEYLGYRESARKEPGTGRSQNNPPNRRIRPGLRDCSGQFLDRLPVQGVRLTPRQCDYQGSSIGLSFDVFHVMTRR